MTILLYQLTIVATLIITRLIAPKRLLTASFIWTAFTAINVFWPPLLVGQLIVIWLAYALLRTQDERANPSDSSNDTGRAKKTPTKSLEIPSSVRDPFPAAIRVNERNNEKTLPIADVAVPATSTSANDQATDEPQSTFRMGERAGLNSEACAPPSQETLLADKFEATVVSPADTPSIRSVRPVPELSQAAKLDIKNAITQKQLPSLIHFTRASNLNSILTHGLCSVASARAQGIRPNINDHMRLDMLPQAISLSIGFPNHRMFYKYRQQEPNEQWVILVIDPAVLWKQPSAFCQRNAADHRIRKRPLSELMTAGAFTGMFEEIPGISTREDQWLRDDDPTDAQAEALVFETIEPEKIGGVAFDSHQTKKAHEHMLGDRAWQVYKRNSGLFGARSLARSERN